MQTSAVVIGGANLDFKARSTAKATAHTSNPGRASMGPGGVGRNIAENIARLGSPVHLVSVVGSDAIGDTLLEYTAAAGVNIDHVARTAQSTGTYTAVLDADGELIIAISDMEAAAEISADLIEEATDAMAVAGVVVIDGNLSADAMNRTLDLADGVPVIFEPVSVPKATGLKHLIDHRVYAVTPNRDELAALTGLPAGTDANVRAAARALHGRGIELVWVRLGERGSMLCTADGIVYIPAVPTVIEDVTGAGDAMLGAFCHALLDGESPEQAARFGHAAAALTIASVRTVRPDLTVRLIKDLLGDQA